MFPLVLFGLGLLLLATAEKKPPGLGIAPEHQATFEMIGGFPHYRAAVAVKAIQATLFKVAFPTQQPGVVMIQPGPGTPMGPEQFGAYWALLGLHDQGFDIWVPPDFHIPVLQPSAVFFLPPGEPPPAGYALLIGAAHPFPPPPEIGAPPGVA